MSARVSSDDMDILVTAVIIQRQSGGNLAELLDNIANTIRDRVKIKRELKTITAQGRISGLVISIPPFVLCGIIYLISPSQMSLLLQGRWASNDGRGSIDGGYGNRTDTQSNQDRDIGVLSVLAAIVLMVFISCFLVSFTLLYYLKRNRLSISRRLENIKKSVNGTEHEEFSQPLFSRVLRPMLDSMGKTMMKVTPSELVSSLGKKIAKAGNPGNLDVKGWINIQATLSAGLPVITLILCIKSGTPAGPLLY